MPVPSTIADLNTSAASNSPSGGESPAQGDDYIRYLSAFIAQLRDKLDGTSTGATLNTPTLNGAVTFGEGWSLDTSGRLRNTSNEQPGFIATPTGSTAQTSGSTVIFGTATTRGGGFDTSTGIYTVPVAGVYLVMASLCIAGSSADWIRISGSTVGVIDVAYVNPSDTAGGVSYVRLMGIAYLSASETVKVETVTSPFSASFNVKKNATSGANRFQAALLY